MNLNLPPPMSDPDLEARYGQRPKQRLESIVFGLIAITLAVIVIAVVKIVL